MDPVTVDQVKVGLKQVESSGRATLQMDNGAYGYYQILPENWVRWAPKALGTDAGIAMANRDVDGLRWVPSATPENQEIVASWKLNQLLGKFGDWRRAVNSWRNGEGLASDAWWQPGQSVGGTFIWSNGSISYTNAVLKGLGFPDITRQTILPPVPGTQEAVVTAQLVQALADKASLTDQLTKTQGDLDTEMARAADLATQLASMTQARDTLQGQLDDTQAALDSQTEKLNEAHKLAQEIVDAQGNAAKIVAL